MCTRTTRSVIYVDGFTLYYGVLKNTACKWLDLQRFFTLLRPDDDIRAIKYFTAIVAPGCVAADPGSISGSVAADSLGQRRVEVPNLSVLGICRQDLRSALDVYERVRAS